MRVVSMAAKKMSLCGSVTPAMPSIVTLGAPFQGSSGWPIVLMRLRRINNAETFGKLSKFRRRCPRPVDGRRCWSTKQWATIGLDRISRRASLGKACEEPIKRPPRQCRGGLGLEIDSCDYGIETTGVPTWTRL